MMENQISVGLVLREMAKYLNAPEQKIFELFSLKVVDKKGKEMEEQDEITNKDNSIQSSSNGS